jgi:hypothetical protein
MRHARSDIALMVRRLIFVALTCWAFTPSAYAQAQHGGKVGLLQAPNAGTGYDCVYFTVQGVSVPDPAVSSHGWFALPKTHTGYKEILVTLHTAKLTDRVIYAGTTGTTDCGGYAVTSYVYY